MMEGVRTTLELNARRTRARRPEPVAAGLPDIIRNAADALAEGKGQEGDQNNSRFGARRIEEATS